MTAKQTSPLHLRQWTGKHFITLSSAAGNAIGWAKAPLAFHVFLLDRKYDGILDHHSRLNVFGICGMRLPGIFLLSYFAAASNAFLKAKSGMRTLPLRCCEGVSANTVLRSRVGFSVELGRAVITAERNGEVLLSFRAIYRFINLRLAWFSSASANSLNEIGLPQTLGLTSAELWQGKSRPMRSTTLIGYVFCRLQERGSPICNDSGGAERGHLL